MRYPARLALCAALLTATSCVDVSHEDAVDALGEETPGGPSPFHRPGQPCVTCHGELGPAEPEFRLAGTVYLLRNAEDPAAGAVVQIQDSVGKVITVQTNAGGNFWLSPEQWDPVYPIQARVKWGPITKQMNQPINRAASCADCHVPPRPSRTSPGRIYIATNRSDLMRPP
jgi:hypothetical protein